MFYKLFSFQDSRLIFDLFLENKISSFYTSNILNNLTSKAFEVGSLVDTNNLKRICIVKDIPSYLEFSSQKLNPTVKNKKVLQYKGYLVNISSYTNITTFINDSLNKRNRKNLISKKNKLYKNSQNFF